MPSRMLVVGANAHPRLKARNRRFEMCKTHVRPYISDSGAINNGPIANVRRNILRVMARMVELVMCSFSPIAGRPGAIMELPNGVTKV